MGAISIIDIVLWDYWIFSSIKADGRDVSIFKKILKKNKSRQKSREEEEENISKREEGAGSNDDVSNFLYFLFHVTNEVRWILRRHFLRPHVWKKSNRNKKQEEKTYDLRSL